jgi:hypothetical protein
VDNPVEAAREAHGTASGTTGLRKIGSIAGPYERWQFRRNHRLQSLLGNATPEEFEHAYYAHKTGLPTSVAANEKTA